MAGNFHVFRNYVVPIIVSFLPLFKCLLKAIFFVTSTTPPFKLCKTLFCFKVCYSLDIVLITIEIGYFWLLRGIRRFAIVPALITKRFPCFVSFTG